MKKICLYLSLLIMLFLSGCNINVQESENISLLAPSGTPSLGISAYLDSEADNVDYEIVSGSDPLVSAFVNETHDIIIAPVNLGVKMYYNNGNYVHYKTFVWGNTYLASKEPLESLSDLEGKEITAFGQTSTPGIVLQSLLEYYNVNCDVTYLNSVSDTNVLLASGNADIILTAEPSLSKINANGNIYVLDLQTIWMEMTGEYSYPQAGIYVKKSVASQNNITIALQKITNAIKMTTNTSKTATSAIKIDASFEALGEETLKKAIPNCHYAIIDNEKSAINFYLNKLSELGFANQFGGKLPDEGFYLE